MSLVALKVTPLPNFHVVKNPLKCSCLCLDLSALMKSSHSQDCVLNSASLDVCVPDAEDCGYNSQEKAG